MHVVITMVLFLLQLNPAGSLLSVAEPFVLSFPLSVSFLAKDLVELMIRRLSKIF